MRITFNVDQAAALRRGIDAPSSTVVLEVDPATLPETHRQILAEALRDGHIADKKIRVEYYYADHQIALVRPTLEGMMDAIDAIMAARAEVAAKDRAKQEQKLANRRAEIVRLLGTESQEEIKHEGDGVTVRRKCRLPAFVAVESEVPEDLLPAVRERHAAREAAKAAILAELREEHSQKLAAELAEQATQKAEYDALYARLPETLRARHADGYSAEGEVEKAIRTLIRQDAGYIGHAGFGHSYQLTELTDDQYAELLVAKRTAPEGAECEVLLAYDREDRPCSDHADECDIDCEDCLIESTHTRRVVRITWTRGGIEAKAILSLDGSTEYAEPASAYAERMAAAQTA